MNGIGSKAKRSLLQFKGMFQRLTIDQKQLEPYSAKHYKNESVWIFLTVSNVFVYHCL